MRPRPDGQLGPAKSSPNSEIERGETRTESSASLHSEILPAQTPTRITGPLCFRPPLESSGSYIESETPFVSPLLQYQPSFQMPLEPRAYQPVRVYHRVNRGNQRQQPYRQPSINDHIYSRSLLPVLPEEESLQLRVPRGDVVVERNYRMPTKRRGRVTYVCASCNEPIQVRDRYEMAVESEETQRVPSRWHPTSGDQTSIFTSDFLSQSNDDNFSVTGNEHQPRLSSSPTPSGLPLSESMSDTNSLVSSNIEINIPTSNTHANIPANSDIPSSMSDTQQCSSEKTGCVLSNHDRSAEETSAVNADSRTASVSYRLGVSVPTMPAASAHACQVANRVIKHARDNKIPDERSMCCPDCGLFPVLPVTGQCGHTRCTKCIHNYGTCPCGVQPPKDLHVNTLIQGIIVKMLPSQSSLRRTTKTVTRGKQRECGSKQPLKTVSARVGWRSGVRQRYTRGSQGSLTSKTIIAKTITTHAPVSPKTRFEHAKELLSSGRFSEAAPLLARVAASSEPPARIARTLLAQTIGVLSQGRDPRRLTRELYRSVRIQSASTWLKPTDLECVLCYHTYTRPVTTPCGHTYCRTCIERSMDYKKSCALCLRNLDDFDLSKTRETVFICAALSSIDALNPPLPPDPNVIPIFVCTVAYPSIPCPLFIFDPRYWLMIRRVLESGSRKFGMVAYERDRTYSDYGTVLEVCDCVHLEDGRSILSTVGVSRFRVIERDVRDGCDVARIQPLIDVPPTEELVILDLRIMATQIKYKALLWLKNMNKTVRSEIEAAFGQIPHFGHRGEDWWESPDGPAWLWWLIAILPLRSEIKVLILSTKNLLKRMMAVSRTLEAIDQVAITRTATSACELQSALTNAEEWLERSA